MGSDSEFPPEGDRRRTRIVFPSGREARIWKLLVLVASVWASYLTARIEQKFGHPRADNLVCECVMGLNPLEPKTK